MYLEKVWPFGVLCRCVPGSSRRGAGCAGSSMVAKMKGSPVPSPSKLIASTGGGAGGSPDKSPARRSPFHLDDPQYDAERRDSPMSGYAELSKYELTKSAAAAKVVADKKAKEAALFYERQKALKEERKQEAAYKASIRVEELQKMDKAKLAVKEAIISREKEIIETTKKERLIMEARVAERQLKLDAARIHAAEESELDHGRWNKEEEVKAAAEETERLKRLEEAQRINADLMKRVADQEKAEKDRDKRAKAELAIETKKAKEAVAKKQAAREKEGKAQRQANMDYLNKQDRLHWTPPPSPVHIPALAKAIREGKQTKL